MLLDLSGLQPSSKGARIRYANGKRVAVLDGPFAETKELIAGYWIIQVKSREEARNGPNVPRPRTKIRIAKSSSVNSSNWKISPPARLLIATRNSASNSELKNNFSHVDFERSH